MAEKRIRLISTIAICVIATVSLLTLGWFNIRYFENTIVSQTQQHLTTIAESEGRNIEAFVGDIQNEFEMFSNYPEIQRAIANNESLENVLTSDQFNPVKALHNNLQDKVNSMYLLDASGIIQNKIPWKDGKRGTDYSSKPGVKAVMETHEPYVSEVFDTSSGVKCVSVCHPVFKDQKFVGIIRAIIYLEKIADVVAHVQVGQQGYAWIIDDGGDLIVHPNSDLIGKCLPDIRTDRDDGEEEAEEQVVTDMMAGGRGTDCLVFDEFSDEKMVMAWVPINMGGRQWSLVVNVNFQEIASPLKAHSRNVYLGTTCLILVFAAAGFAYYRVDKKKTQLEGYMAVGRVNEQLQIVSTEREEMLAALASQKELMQSIVSAFPYAIFWKNTDLVYQDCNNKFAKIVGTDGPDSIIGKTDDDLPWKPEQAKTFADRDREVIRAGIGLLNVEQQWHRSNGKIAPMLASHVPLRDSGGKVIGTLGVYMDITELKAAWEDIRAELNRFSAAVSSMDEGVVICDTDGTVLHANPYFANLTNKKHHEIIGNNISEALDPTVAKQVNAIIDDFSKTDAPRTGVARQTVDDRDFDIRLHGVYADNILTSVAINVIDVSGLVDAMERAEYAKHTTNKFFANMSHNIRTPMNSIVGFAEVLTQEELSDEQLKFAGTIHESALDLLGIIDKMIVQATTQPGAPEDEPTVRHSKPKQRSVQQATQPEPQNEIAPTAELPETTPQEQQPEDKPHVLVVDDIIENRMLLEVLLRKNGYQITVCSSGEQAVEFAAKDNFDVILMDIKMSDMDGLEATKSIKRSGPNSKTPVLAMTASTEGGTELTCLEAGCDDYIAKPIKKEILLRKIQRFIEQERQARNAHQGGDISSFLVDKPDYHRTIDMFVNNLPDRINEMQNALDEGNLQDLAFKIHALKGLGGFAGFPIYTERAKSLEQSIQNDDLSDVRQQLDELVQLCMRTRKVNP